MLVVAGLGVTGAIFGIMGAQFIAFVYAAWWASRLGLQRPNLGYYGRLPDLKALLPELKYASFVFVGLLAITLMMSVDVILVKYYFDAQTAGLYAGVATVARILFFLAVPIAQVLIPLVKVKQTARENYRLLAKSLILTVGICGVVLAVCIGFPESIMKILMGEQYVEYANILPMLALVVFIISLVNLVIMYYLALRHKIIVLVGIIGFAVLIGFVLTWHGDVRAIVHSMLYGSIFTLLATGIYVVVNLRRGLLYANNKDDLDHHPNL
jgi:O-antigen/teichoic acid export membrane protein